MTTITDKDFYNFIMSKVQKVKVNYCSFELDFAILDGCVFQPILPDKVAIFTEKESKAILSERSA